MSSALAPLQAITHRIPGFVRDPLIAVIGKECYTSLVWNTDISDVDCLKYSLSKVLGLGLVAGGGIVKVPQIIKIIQSGSARGISLVSYLLDTASLLIVVAYNARQHFPFSTYGENAFLVIQNVVIVLLVIAYSRTSGKAIKAATFMSAIGASAYALSNSELVNIDFLRTLLAASIPLSLSSKVPQIAKIYSQGSTGQLSAFLVFNSLAGCLARVFTTMTETGDKTLWWSFVSASVLNGVIALQMLYYWNASSRESKVAGKKSKSSSGRTVESQLKEKANGGAVPVLSPPTSSGSTAAVVSPVTPGKAQGAPARQPASSAKRSASRNYTRKVD